MELACVVFMPLKDTSPEQAFFHSRRDRFHLGGSASFFLYAIYEVLIKDIGFSHKLLHGCTLDPCSLYTLLRPEFFVQSALKSLRATATSTGVSLHTSCP